MKNYKELYVNRLNNRESSIETRLLQFYITTEIIWAIVNCVACFLIGTPTITAIIYGGTGAFLIIFFGLGFFFDVESLFSSIYFILVYITIPIIWYFAGGTRTSANILFVCELVLYSMCMNGKRQKIFLVLSVLSTGFVQNFTSHMPVPVFPMTPEQYQKSGAVLGISTSILIACLLLRQKKEYARERDLAIESEKLLEKSNQLQKNFLANMSHEIRSPLGIVLGFNNLIQSSSDIDQIHEYSNDISHAGSTLLTIINDILDYSKIESGKLDIIEADYSLSDMIVETSKDIQIKCSEKKLDFITNYSNNLPKYLHGDNIRIKQCLVNVLSNAVKYTDEGSVTFSVTSKETSTDNYSIIFTVSDTGKGISSSAIPHLYSAFKRLDEDTNRGIEGTGLGLAITKNLLDEMNGTIEVVSELGTGTTFVITIPQKKGAPVENQVTVDIQKNLSGIRILVVDDAKLNLTVIKKLLEKEDAIVTTIDNGRDCLANTINEKYDIIMLDHMMPEMNGIEVFNELKKQDGANKNTPVVMLTANAMTGVEQEYIDLGFDAYISKPVNPQEMRSKIQGILRN